MQNQFDEQTKGATETDEENSDYAYKSVIKKDKTSRRTWSVISLIFAVLSILTLYFSWVSLVIGAVAVGCAAVSRKNLGYFDKISLAGIIIGIFGMVFSLTGIIFGGILASFL